MSWYSSRIKQLPIQDFFWCFFWSSMTQKGKEFVRCIIVCKLKLKMYLTAFSWNVGTSNLIRYKQEQSNLCMFSLLATGNHQIIFSQEAKSSLSIICNQQITQCYINLYQKNWNHVKFGVMRCKWSEMALLFILSFNRSLFSITFNYSWNKTKSNKQGFNFWSYFIMDSCKSICCKTCLQIY